jgi:P-type Ca2+ transporter type 2C
MCSYGYAVARYGIGPQANSAAFMTLTAAQLLHAYSCRSDRHSIFDRTALQPNPYLKLALAGTGALQLAAVAVPGLRSLLGTALPSPMDMAVIAAGSGLPFLVNEATKATRVRPFDSEGREELAPSVSDAGGAGR